MSFRSLRNKGFTLIEVLIAMTILIFIGIAIFQATTGTYRIRDELITEGDFFNAIRLSMGILERDVALVYSPKMMIPPSALPKTPTPGANLNPYSSAKSRSGGMNDNAGDNTMMNYPDLQLNSTFWSAAVHKSGFRPGRFIGKDNQFSFIAGSKLRVYKDSKESEFVKVKYELKPDPKGKDNPKAGQNILVKTESINAFLLDDTGDKMVRTFPLLPGVTKIKFKYYNKEKKDWSQAWDSDSADQKDTYPDMIEVALEVKGSDRLEFEGLYHFRPEIPLAGGVDASY